MKKLLMTLVLLNWTCLGAWGALFDTSTVLPELAKAAKGAQAALADYRNANKTAELSAQQLAAGFASLPQDKRDEAKAKALCQLETSLKTMSEKLEAFHATMSGIQGAIEGGVSGGLGAVRERLDGLVSQFTNEIVEKERSSSALLRLAAISPGAVGETEAQKLNHAMDEVDQRRGLLKKLQERRERIAAIHETIQQKIESIRAVTSAVEARIAELKTEAYLVDVLKKEHQVEIVTNEVFGLGRGADPVRIFDSKSSQALDEMLGRKVRGGGLNQRESLKLRLKEVAQSGL